MTEGRADLEKSYRDLYERALEDSSSSRLLCDLARASLSLGREEEASYWYRQSLVSPSSEAYLALGELSGDIQESVSFFRRALALNPSDSKALALLGRTLLKTGEAEEAESFLRSIESPEVFESLSEALLSQGKMEEGFSMRQKLFKNVPDREELFSKAVHLSFDRLGTLILFSRFLTEFQTVFRPDSLAIDVPSSLEPLLKQSFPFVKVEEEKEGPVVLPIDTLPYYLNASFEKAEMKTAYLALSREKTGRIGISPGLDRETAEVFVKSLRDRPVVVWETADEFVSGSFDAVIGGVDDPFCLMQAAALKPAFMLTDVRPSWRYEMQKGGKLWYPSLRMFKLSQVGELDRVLSRL